MCMLSHFSYVQLFVTPWTVVRLAPLSMGFSRQEYWSGLPHPFPGDLPDPGIEPMSFMSPAGWQVGSLPLAPPGKPVQLHINTLFCKFMVDTGMPPKEMKIPFQEWSTCDLRVTLTDKPQPQSRRASLRRASSPKVTSSLQAAHV